MTFYVLQPHFAGEVVDCAEGTQIQLLKARIPKASKISKIFVTHLHVDHCCGIVPFMNTAMSSAHNPGQSSKLDDMVRLELYGPSGLRKLIRTNLQITQTLLRGKYAAHELLFENDTPTTCGDHELHYNELPGKDIRADSDGFWRHFEDSNGIKVDAAPLVHRVPCLGYVFTEGPQFRISKEYLGRLDAIPLSLLPKGVTHPRALLGSLASEAGSQPILLNDGSLVEPPPRDVLGRKVVILGDTSDPSAIIPLAQDASFLVHEATNAWIPSALDKGRHTLKTPAEVREKAINRGHSTPDMAGEFANTIRARRLFLNHFSVKFPDPGPYYRNGSGRWARVMQEIEGQASWAWKMGRAVAGSDLLVVDIPAPGQDVGMLT